MAALIYSLCAITCLLSAGLLFREYKRTRFRLLFWSALCFTGFTLNNVLLVLDRFVYTQMDLSIPRLATGLVSLLLLLYGLIWEGD